MYRQWKNETRKQGKGRKGKWNGVFALYGYKLVSGKLKIEEWEAEAVRIIYDKYVNTELGSNGVAKYLAQQGINKIVRQNGSNTMFDAHLIRTILDNPVYCGYFSPFKSFCISYRLLRSLQSSFMRSNCARTPFFWLYI